MAVEYHCCEPNFFINILIIVFLVLFAGLMSGLTLGLMSLSLVDLEVLSKSGSPQDRKHAAKILPVVRRQHLLLCTLLICNAAAMEALPIFLDSLVTAWGAILISVTLILLFGEIIPQSICSRYGLAIGAAVVPVVRLLVWICFPVAYPISKFLDFMLGDEHMALFRRAELKTLVNLHGNAAGKGGELTHDETTIIAGALELTEKKAKDAMTPISQTFAIDINAKLDRVLMNQIMERGHSRVPVCHGKPTNIIGLILVKNLLSIHPDDEVPVKNVTIRKIPRVHENMPLYDILNDFQKGHSHMAVVTKQIMVEQQSNSKNDVRVDIDGDKPSEKSSIGAANPICRLKSYPPNSKSNRGGSRNRKWSRDGTADVLQIDDKPLPGLNEEEAIGIITMEDVIEELLQEEIFDETDHQEENV
ncbi:DUF21 domain-containing protein At2g14520-like isoform X1 [Zingiber officinale]|uniref:DUF21 domain-containing protein At2g14520-like isoform X1 n=1 Tax=Zingiber officinale TaxID=94328 RepID=UPI001C4CC30D|nr:DUF21 domain-containing protein At2g14520-like isoform X1 [Zingiber officinale]